MENHRFIFVLMHLNLIITHMLMNIKCLTARCQFCSLVAARLLVLGVGHGGLEIDRLAAPGLVSVTAAICDLLLGHYSVDF